MRSTVRPVAGDTVLDPGPMTRRAVLQGAGIGAIRLGAGRFEASRAERDRSPRAVILLLMVGGASPRETFDPQPDMPSRCRGPFGSIATAVPGVRVSEHLPEVARRLDRLSLIRSVYHDADPTHGAGLQLLATGRSDPATPALGSRVAAHLGATGGMPPFVILPDRVGLVGGPPTSPDLVGSLGPAFEPFVVGHAAASAGNFDLIAGRARRWVERATARGLASAGGARPDWSSGFETRASRDTSGRSDFERHCRLARRLVAAGSRFVVVPMASTVFGQPSWDTHGRAPFSAFDDLARHLLPAFDQGVAGLVDDLQARGLLESTLVVATGEFGRTPWINESGGRDHWPGVWSALVAGGGTPGGQVLGSSTPDGHPGDRPVHLGELVATMEQFLGLPPDPRLDSRAGAPWRPVDELVG